MWPNPQFPADLVTFTEEIRNGKLRFFVQCVIQPVQIRRYPSVILTDADFEDDIALISNTVKETKLLQRVEEAAKLVGLYVNDAKTEYGFRSTKGRKREYQIVKKKKCVDYFKYFGSWMQSSERDVSIRIGLAWFRLSKMLTILESYLNKELKITSLEPLFKA